MKESIILALRSRLGFVSGWGIDRVHTDQEKQQVDLYVSHDGRALICPETGEVGTVYDPRKERVWRHLDLLESKCFVHCKIPRVTSSVGIKTVVVPWAEASKSSTYAFERWGINTLEGTQTAAAKLIRCNFDLVNRIMHRSVARGMKRRTLEEVEELSVDEKAFQRGHTYATILRTGNRTGYWLGQRSCNCSL